MTLARIAPTSARREVGTFTKPPLAALDADGEAADTDDDCPAPAALPEETAL